MIPSLVKPMIGAFIKQQNLAQFYKTAPARGLLAILM